MSDATKELRIKYVLDQTQFSAAQKDVNKSILSGVGSANDLGKAMMQVVGLQAGLGAVSQVVGAITSSMQEAADYTKRVAEAFGATRESMREIAAIAGKGASNEFVQGQLDSAKRAQILTSGEYVQGVQAFQQYGSNYIGSRVSQETLDSVMPEVLAAAKINGVAPAEAMQLFAKLVQSNPKGTTAEEYKTQFAKELQMSRDAAGSATMTVKNLSPILSQYVNPGGVFEPTREGIQDATKLVSVMSETNAEEAGTYTRQGIETLSKIDIKDKDASFGITDDMDIMKKIEAMTATFMNETGGKGDVTKWLRKKLGGQGGNIQGVAALATWINKGVREGGFKGLGDKVKDVDAGSLDDQMATHLASSLGKDDVAAATVDIAERERGLQYADVETMRKRARGELTKEGAFEGWTQVLNPYNWRGGKSVEEAQVNQRALTLAQRQASAAGVDAYDGPDATAAPVAGLGSSELTIRNEIKRLVDLTEQANAQRSRQVPSVPPPLNGRPSAPGQMPR